MVPLGNRETKGPGSREALALLNCPSSSQSRRFKEQGARIGSGISGVGLGTGGISLYWKCVTVAVIREVYVLALTLAINPQFELASNPILPNLQRERRGLQRSSGDIGAGPWVSRPRVRDHTAPPWLVANLGSRGAGSARSAPGRCAKSPRVPAPRAAGRLSVATKRWSREEEPRTPSGRSRESEGGGGGFPGRALRSYHGVWEESPRSLRYLRGSPRR